MNKSKMIWVLTGIVGLFASTVDAASLVQHHTFDSDFSDAFGRTATGLGDAQITTDAIKGAGSLILDGVGDSVALDTKLALNGLTNWSIAAWIKPTSAAEGIQAIFATTWVDGGAHFNYQVLSGVPNVGVSLYSNTEATSTTTNVPLAPTNWFHVALTRGDSSSLRLYINGVEEASTGMTGAVTDLGLAADIGRSSDFARHFTGQIDDFRIYDGALSASEISTLAIPEPGSVMLFGAGLMVLIYIRRRFQSK